MVAVSAIVDDAELRKINGALDTISSEMGDAAGDAPKRAAIYVCSSLKKRTRKASTKKKPSDWGAEPLHHSGMRDIIINGRHYRIPTPSPYITNPRNGRHGRSNGLILHRYMFTTRKGTPGAHTFPVAAYSHLKHNRNGRVVTDKTAEIRELREIYAKNYHAGLAKQSWGWAAHEVSGKGSDLVWRRRKHDRNPREAVSGSYTQYGAKTSAGGVAEIHNKLDYIVPALYPSALESSFDAATEKLMWYYKQLAAEAAKNFWADNGLPLERRYWNALEKRLWPEAFASAI